MKRIRPRLMIALLLLIAILILTVVVLQIAWNEVDYEMISMGPLVSAILFYLSFVTKIEFNDEYLYFYGLWKKIKIDYKDIVEIYSSANPFGYSLKSFDTQERRFLLMFPLEHKRMRELFDAIEKANPDAQINIMWYKKEKHEKHVDFKTLIKWACFIVAICLADYVYRRFIK